MDYQASQREQKREKGKERSGRGHTTGGARKKIETAKRGEKKRQTQEHGPCSSNR
jgi:hypothetical protein